MTTKRDLIIAEFEERENKGENLATILADIAEKHGVTYEQARDAVVSYWTKQGAG